MASCCCLAPTEALENRDLRVDVVEEVKREEVLEFEVEEAGVASALDEKRDLRRFLAGGGWDAGSTVVASTVVGVSVVVVGAGGGGREGGALAAISDWYCLYISLKCSHSESSL